MPAGLMPGLAEHNVPQSGGPFGDVCAFDGWPGVPIDVIAGRDDRFFPLDLQLRVARERLGIEPEVVPGGHLALLSRPAELAAALDRCLRAVSGSGAGRPR
jgi:pimeloyl-ACP methyl ester carboxylesterase